MWFSVACFGTSVSVRFHLTFVHYTTSLGLVAEWLPFGKQLPSRLAICTNCILSVCILLISILFLRAGYGF